MPIADIDAWLKQTDKNYSAGVSLYNRYGTSALLKAFFNSGKGAYHLTRLIDTFTKINPGLSEKLELQPATPPQVTTTVPDPKRSPIYALTDNEWSKAPDPIKDLYVANKRLKAEAEMLHHSIRVTGSRSERLNMALTLLDQRDRSNDNWTEIKKYQATGKVTEKITAERKKTVAEMTIGQLTAVIKNYPSYISKANAALKNMPTGSKRDKKEALLLEREIELKLATERMANE